MQTNLPSLPTPAPQTEGVLLTGQLENLDQLMSLAVTLADARPGQRGRYLRIWSSLKNTQRRAEGLPALAGLPAASAGEVAQFLQEMDRLDGGDQ